MAMQTHIEQKTTIFKKQPQKGVEQWFVRVTCNFLDPRVYGPFPTEEEADRFRGGAEFELRKLLDCELPSRSGAIHLNIPKIG